MTIPAISGPSIKQKLYRLVSYIPVVRTNYYMRYFTHIGADHTTIHEHEKYLDVTRPSSNVRNGLALAVLAAAVVGAVGGAAFFGMIPAISAGVGVTMFIAGASGTGVFACLLLLQQGYMWGHKAAFGYRFLQTVVDTHRRNIVPLPSDSESDNDGK